MPTCSINYAPGERKDGWISCLNWQESWLTPTWVWKRPKRSNCFGNNPPHHNWDKGPSVRLKSNARTIVQLCAVLTVTNIHVGNAERRNGSARIVSDCSNVFHSFAFFVNMLFSLQIYFFLFLAHKNNSHFCNNLPHENWENSCFFIHCKYVLFCIFFNNKCQEFWSQILVDPDDSLNKNPPYVYKSTVNQVTAVSR